MWGKTPLGTNVIVHTWFIMYVIVTKTMITFLISIAFNIRTQNSRSSYVRMTLHLKTLATRKAMLFHSVGLVIYFLKVMPKTFIL